MVVGIERFVALDRDVAETVPTSEKRQKNTDKPLKRKENSSQPGVNCAESQAKAGAQDGWGKRTHSDTVGTGKTSSKERAISAGMLGLIQSMIGSSQKLLE